MLLHVAVVMDHMEWAVRGVLYLVGLSIATKIKKKKGVIPGVVMGIVSLILIESALYYIPYLDYLLYLLPVLIQGGIAWLFLRTLHKSHVPLVTHFAYLVHDESDTFSRKFLTYTYRQTVLWGVICATYAVLAVLLAIYADKALWSFAANEFAPLSLVLLFILCHLYSHVCYGVKESPRRTFAVISDPMIWLKTRIHEVPYAYTPAASR